MKMYLSLGSFVYLVLLNCQFAIGGPSSSQCDTLRSEADSCVRRGLVFGGHFTPPKTVKDMETICKAGRQYVSCAKRYSPCLRMMPKQVYSILLSNSRKLLKDTCSGSGRQEFLEHASSMCLTAGKLSTMGDEMERLTLSLNYVASNVSSDDLLPWTCCAYFKSHENIERQIRTICSPQPTPQKTVEFFVDLMKKSVSEAIDLACGQYSSWNACRRKLPNAVATLDSLVPSGGQISRQPTTFLTPLIRIAHRIDE